MREGVAPSRNGANFFPVGNTADPLRGGGVLPTGKNWRKFGKYMFKIVHVRANYAELFYKRSPKDGSPYAIRPLSVCPVCLSILSVCDVGVLWPNGWMDQDETWHAGRPRPWPHCVRWGPSSLSSKRGWRPPIFGPYLLCQMAVCGPSSDGRPFGHNRHGPKIGGSASLGELGSYLTQSRLGRGLTPYQVAS